MPVRDSYIPAAKADLALALAEHNPHVTDDATQFTDFCRVLSAVMHYETFDELERLKRLYRPLDPAEQTIATADHDAFLRELENILEVGNFLEFGVADVMAGAAVGNLQDLKVRTTDAAAIMSADPNSRKLAVARMLSSSRRKPSGSRAATEASPGSSGRYSAFSRSSSSNVS